MKRALKLLIFSTLFLGIYNNINATGVHFTKLELHESDVTGTIVCDLLTNTAPVLKLNQEYYIVAIVKKDNVSDDCWMSIDIPYWFDVINPEGGMNWTKSGANISTSSTAFDKIISYTKSSGYSSAYSTTAGKAVYHIKSTVNEAQFYFSIRATPGYWNFDTSDQGQIVTTESLKFECGDMSGSAIGSTADSYSTTSIAKVYKTAPRQYYGDGTNATVAWNETGTSYHSFCLPLRFSSGHEYILDKFEFDVEYQTGITNSIQYYGETLTPQSSTTAGSNTIDHYVFEKPGGIAGSSNARLSISASFDNSFPDGTYPFTIKNITSRSYGDEHAVIHNWPNNTVFYFYLKNELNVKLTGMTISKYDWHGQYGITNYNDKIVSFNLEVEGSQTAQIVSQTIEVNMAPNVLIRAICVPKGTDFGSTIVINGNTYNISDVAYQNTATYCVIRNIDIGLSQDATISSFVYEIGKLNGEFFTTKKGATTSTGAPHVRYPGETLSANGYSTDGNVATSTARVYATGSDPNDAANITVKTATQKFTPGTTCTIGASYLPTTTDESIVAGTSFSHTFNMGYPTYYYGNTHYMKNPVVYLTLPTGIDATRVTISDVETIKTLLRTETDGTKIYECVPINTIELNGCLADMTNLSSIKFVVDFTTDKALTTQTIPWNELISIGCKDYPVSFSSGNDDTYNINGGRRMLTYNDNNLVIQEFKEVAITNSMTVTSNGTPLNRELTYNDGLPNDTRAYVKNDFSASYKVVIKNQTGEIANDLKVFIPIAKEGQTFGNAFNIGGIQEFDINMVADSVPTGWSIEYIKIANGKTYTSGNYPQPADYTVTTASDANMILIKAPSALADKAGATFTFTVTGNSSVADYAGAVDIWNCVPVYLAGSTLHIPDGSPEAIEIALGEINGYVYNDLNNNGIQDIDEPFISGISVVSTDSKGRIISDTTDLNGYYKMDYIRNTSTTGTNTSVTVKTEITNPNNLEYKFSPKTDTGNHPSNVTPVSNHINASMNNIKLTKINSTVEVNAGLRALRFSKSASLNGVRHNGLLGNPVTVLGNERIEYTLVGANIAQIIDTLPGYLKFNAVIGSTPNPDGYPNIPTNIYGQQILKWTISGAVAREDSVVFEAVPESGVCASQPLFINTAMIMQKNGTAIATNSTYHQGGGVAIVTFSAAAHGEIFNAEPQAVDFKSTAENGVLIVPDEGYEFAGWKHDAYYSMRDSLISAENGIMNYDTMTIYGDVELQAIFVRERTVANENVVETQNFAFLQSEVWSNNNTLYVKAANSVNTISIYNTAGVLIRQQQTVCNEVTEITLPNGIYIVCINDGIGKKVKI